MASSGRGFRILLDRFPQIIAEHPIIVGAIVERTARMIEADMKASMSGSGGGRVYVRDGVSHTASAPGQPPAIDTGTLVNSVKARPDGALRWVVEVGAEYGIYLEYGTRRMAARPFAAPAAERARPMFLAALKAGLGGLH